MVPGQIECSLFSVLLEYSYFYNSSFKYPSGIWYLSNKKGFPAALHVHVYIISFFFFLYCWHVCLHHGICTYHQIFFWDTSFEHLRPHQHCQLFSVLGYWQNLKRNVKNNCVGRLFSCWKGYLIMMLLHKSWICDTKMLLIEDTFVYTFFAAAPALQQSNLKTWKAYI